MKALAAAGVTLLFAGGCGDSTVPESGEVIEKGYDTPDEWMQMVCVAYSQYGCTVHTPIFHQDGPHWSLKLAADGEDGWVEVNEATWNEVQVGQWFDSETGEVVAR